MRVNITVRNFSESPIKAGEQIWIKYHRNKSRMLLAYARNIEILPGQWIVSITAATKKENDNYKSHKMIKRLHE